MKYGVETNNQKALNFIEECYIKDLLSDPNITDVSFNGESLFYLDNFKGRQKSKIVFTNEMAKDFLRQLANLSEQQFSFSSPILDVSVGKYRINGVFHSIGRYENDKRCTFSIRVGSSEPKISNDSGFLSKKLISLFKTLLRNKISIVIAGSTGSGKTELQKYLISQLEENTRVIVVDNVLELDIVRDSTFLDLNIWQADESKANINVQSLVKNALRSNPDWLIVSEARGSEMIEVLNSSMTGHPIITTLHAFDVESIPTRAVRMVLMNEKKLDYDDVMNDFIHHIKIGVYLKRKIDKDGNVTRYISDVVEFVNKGKVNYLFHLEKSQCSYGNISENLLKLLDEDSLTEDFKKTFIKEENK